jgi:hypothetical protein
VEDSTIDSLNDIIEVFSRLAPFKSLNSTHSLRWRLSRIDDFPFTPLIFVALVSTGDETRAVSFLLRADNFSRSSGNHLFLIWSKT